MCTLNLFCRKARYWVDKWPSQFIANVDNSVVTLDEDTKLPLPACCFKITSKDGAKTIKISPETQNFYEFEEENPVYNVERCVCDNC